MFSGYPHGVEIVQCSSSLALLIFSSGRQYRMAPCRAPQVLEVVGTERRRLRRLKFVAGAVLPGSGGTEPKALGAALSDHTTIGAAA